MWLYYLIPDIIWSSRIIFVFPPNKQNLLYFLLHYNIVHIFKEILFRQTKQCVFILHNTISNIQIFSIFPFTTMDIVSGWYFSAYMWKGGPGSGDTCKQSDTCTCQVTWPAVSLSRPLTAAAMNLTQNLVIFALSVLVTLVPHIPGQHGGRQHSVQKPTRFYIGGVLSSTAMARAFTMEAQVTDLWILKKFLF